VRSVGTVFKYVTWLLTFRDNL